MAESQLVATKVKVPEHDLRVQVGDTSAPVFIMASLLHPDLHPEELALWSKTIAQRVGRHWRKDHTTQICFDWFGDNVVEYFVGSLYGMNKVLGMNVQMAGCDPATMAIWLLNIRPPTAEEVACRQREEDVPREDLDAEDEADREIKPAKVDVPKVPSLIQKQIDSLIEKSKCGNLTAEEQASLDELLDYLDDLTIHELKHAPDHTE